MLWLIIPLIYLAGVPLAIRKIYVHLDSANWTRGPFGFQKARTDRQNRNTAVFFGLIWPISVLSFLLNRTSAQVGKLIDKTLFGATPRQRKIMDETRAAEAERYLRANDPESATILARTGGAEAGGFAARAHRRT